MEENLYELIFNEEYTEGVYGVSLVNDPAIQIEAITFSNELEDKKIEIKLADSEKRILVSPVLIPNQKIYRNSIGEDKQEGYVFFSAETIEKLQQNFFKNQFNHNSSLEHSDVIEDGVFIFESWLIDNPSNDKSNEYGFNLPKGTWMISMKIDNDEIWEDYIKTGLVKGVSIDSEMLSIKSNKIIENNIKLKKQMKSKETLKSVLKKAIQVKFAEELKVHKTVEGSEVKVAELAVGQLVYDANDDLMKDAEFVIDNTRYYTDKDGYIYEVDPIDGEDVEFNDEMIADALEEVIEELDIFAEYKAEVERLKGIVAELQAELDSARVVVEEKEKEVIEMKKAKPASQGVRTNLSKSKSVEKVGGLLGLLRNE